MRASRLPMNRTMKAMVLTGHGGLDRYEWREDRPVPEPGPMEVLIRVGACGLNNTDVNTRTGWYSRGVTEATTGDVQAEADEGAVGWGGRPIRFPRIQGADVVGEAVAVGEGAYPGLVGRRVMVDAWLRDPSDPENPDKTGYFGSEADGGFAEYTKCDVRNVAIVESDLTDAELATFSCSYTTAEGMLNRACVGAEDTVLVPGASGGVSHAPFLRIPSATLAPTTHQNWRMSRSDTNLPSTSSSLPRSSREAVAPRTDPSIRLLPKLTPPAADIRGAASPMAETASASASAVSSGIPGSFVGPRTLTVTISVPSASNCLRDSAVAISPVEIIAITEAMPIMMPMRPSTVRSRARVRLRNASRRLSVIAGPVRFTARSPPAPRCLQAARRPGSASGARTAWKSPGRG